MIAALFQSSGTLYQYWPFEVFRIIFSIHISILTSTTQKRSLCYLHQY